MTFYLDPALEPYFSQAKPYFDQIMALKGEKFRHQDGRVTQRILIGGHYFFIKQHYGVGLKEIFKNLLQGRLPILSAKNEWQAIRKLSALKIATPVVVGYGQRGLNPAKLQSFVLLKELSNVVSLETLCKDWQKQMPTYASKQDLIKKVANIARTMHKNGINHRDFYICHFLLNQSQTKDDKNDAVLHLIDLHRAGIRARCPSRWIIKDLAALYFSSKDIGLTKRDLLRFMRWYRQKNLREIIFSEQKFWQKVQLRGEKLYRDHNP